MTTSMTQKLHCRADTFISVSGTLTHASGFMDKSIQDIDFSDLPHLPHNFIYQQNQNDQIDIVHERQLSEQMLHQLNNDQRHIHNNIVNALTSDSHQNCYIVDGPAGTGKTFLYNAVVHNLQAVGIQVKCMAY